MAKPAKVTGDGVDKELLKRIVDATASGPDGFVYVSQVEGQPMVGLDLIVVNTGLVDPNDGTKVAARSTDKAAAYLAANVASANGASATSSYAIITNAIPPPPKKRGNTSGSGAPTKYPFADLEVGGSFFSANSEHAKGDAVKGLGSTVSAQNDKYSENTAEMKTVTRAVRDKQTKKAKLDANGAKVTETVQLPVKKYNRKFTIRPVVGGEKYGEWVAPADGALITRSI